MPLYEYECSKCEHKTELLQTFDASLVAKCEECGAVADRVLFSKITIVYKCAGFYTTDQRGLTGHKRKPNIKVGMTSDLSPEDQDRAEYKPIVGDA